MKIVIKLLSGRIILLFFLGLLFSCVPRTEPIEKKIQGTWRLMSVSLTKDTKKQPGVSSSVTGEHIFHYNGRSFGFSDVHMVVENPNDKTHTVALNFRTWYLGEWHLSRDGKALTEILSNGMLVPRDEQTKQMLNTYPEVAAQLRPTRGLTTKYHVSLLTDKDLVLEEEVSKVKIVLERP